MLTQRFVRLSVAVLASIASMALSWPFWRDFEYWPESEAMWLIYFAVGFVLAVYVFYAFLDSLGTLFEHDALAREARPAEAGESATREEEPA